MTGPVDQIIEATLNELQRRWQEQGRQGLDAWKQAQAAGQQVTGYGLAPYGYRWKRVVVLEEDPYEQEVEALMVELFAGGLNNQEAADVLNGYGYLTTRGEAWGSERVKYHRRRLGFAPAEKPRCEVDECPRLAIRGGMCARHHYKLERYGDPLAKGGPQPRTHCPQGHSYDEENTYTDPSGRKSCRICNRAKVRRFYERHPEKSRKRPWSTTSS